ncbi:MAG: hypothetical protein ACYC9O_02950 [Candidatus Latescibacterota bacterium]
MGLTMPDALVILGLLATVITALITIFPSLIKPKLPPACATCPEHSGVMKMIEALNTTLTRLQDTMDKMTDYFMRKGEHDGR